MSMASNSVIAPLCGSNYATWKLQCKMSLLKDNLWGIVSGTEKFPTSNEGGAQGVYSQRRDKSLGHYSAVYRSVPTVPPWRFRRPEDHMGLSLKTVSEEIMGKQTEFASKVVRFEARRRWIGSRSYQRHHRDI